MLFRRSPIQLFAVLLWLTAAAAAAQTADVAAGSIASRPAISAFRTDAAPSVDGRLDDLIWQRAAAIDRFVQYLPVEGAPATESTKVYVAYDAQTLYFGIHAHYSDLSLMRSNRVDRDKIDLDDIVTVSLDPFQDQQRGYAFSVNAFGVQGDAILTQGFGVNTTGDASWNVLFDSAGTLVEDGWTAEMAIPIKSLRYPGRGAGEAHEWGLQVLREIRSKDETSVWSPVSGDAGGFLAQMGTLDGLRDLSTQRNLEILPTATAVSVGVRNADGAFETDDVQEAGINVKYGVTSNLTLDVTVNPDFSQVESDRQQIEINQRFPLSYPELRPFFLEGKEIFFIQMPVTLLHTRTIIDPQFGAKLTGKVGKAAVGLIVANDEAPGKVERSDPAFGRTAQTFAGRLRYDLYRESHIGAVFTDREFMNSYSRVQAYDGAFRIGQTFSAFYKALYSHHRDRLGVTRTGSFIDLAIRKDSRNLTGFVATNMLSPDFRTDAGFVSRVDMKRYITSWTYKWWPESWIVNWGPTAGYDRFNYFDGGLQEEARYAQIDAQFARNVSARATVNADRESYAGREFDKRRVMLKAEVATSRRMSVSATVARGDRIRFIADPYLGRSTTVNLAMTLRPVSRLQSVLTVDSDRLVDPRSSQTAFDIKIVRALTTYQFTDRLLVRHILDQNTFDKKVGTNILVTYRVNAGTAFLAGYDERFQAASRLPNVRPDVTPIFDGYERTNRAIFAKLQYLYRR